MGIGDLCRPCDAWIVTWMLWATPVKGATWRFVGLTLMKVWLLVPTEPEGCPATTATCNQEPSFVGVQIRVGSAATDNHPHHCLPQP